MDGVSVNATVQFSRIITFWETEGLLGGLGLEGDSPRLILELYISGRVKCCTEQPSSSAIKMSSDTKYHGLTARICI